MIKEYLFRSGLSAHDARQVTLVVVRPVNSEHAAVRVHALRLHDDGIGERPVS